MLIGKEAASHKVRVEHAIENQEHGEMKSKRTVARNATADMVFAAMPS